MTTERPTVCSDCKSPFLPGQSVFGSKSDSTAVLCESCAKKRMPICDSCGTPIIGGSVKIGEKLFHLECLRCAMCKKLPEGSCSQMGSKFVCGQCMDHVKSEAFKANELIAKGDTQGAAAIAQKLVAQGIDLPPELLSADGSSSAAAGSSSAAPAEVLSCTLCAKQIRDQYSKMGKSVLCMDCGSEVRSQMQQARELAEKGDEAGALAVAKALADRGLQELLGQSSAVPDCAMCLKPVSGKCARMGEAIICEACGVGVNTQIQQIVDFIGRGEISQAAKVAKGLTDKGLKIPQEMMQALSQAPPSCVVCSKPINGKCAKMGEGLVCSDCGESINVDMRRAQELVMKGDVAAAAEIARNLKAKGVPVPDKLTEGSVSQRPPRSGSTSPAAPSPAQSKASGLLVGNRTLAKAGAQMLSTDTGNAASQADLLPLKDPLAETRRSNASAIDEVLAELAPPPAESIPDAAAEPEKKKPIPGSGPAYDITCHRATQLIKKRDMKGVQQIATGMECMNTEVPEFIQKALDEWQGEALKECIEKGNYSAVQAIISTGKEQKGARRSTVGSASEDAANASKAAKETTKPSSETASGTQHEPVAGSGSSAAKALLKRSSQGSAASLAKAKAASPAAKATAAPAAKAKAGAASRQSVTGRRGSTPQPKAAAAKAKAAAPVAGTSSASSAPPTNSTLPPDDVLELAADEEAMEKTEAPAGALGVHRAESKEPVPFAVLGMVTDAADDGSFISADDFSGEESGVLQKMQTWNCRARLHDKDWEVQVRGIPAPGETSTKIALFLHGAGDDRCFGFWAKFWSVLHAAGYHILTLDMPGHGHSSSRRLPARDAQDAELVLAICAAFTDLRPGQISCFADAGGASAFIRAYVLRPTIFAAHHVLTNPVVAEIPPKLRAMFERHGNDLFVLAADGWGKTDIPFTVANCGQMLGFVFSWMERLRFTFLIAPEPGPIASPGAKAMREATYLFGKKVPVPSMSRESSFYCLLPSDDCLQEIVSYLESPRLPPVVAGGPSAPAMTALEMGEVNESFRVFVRIRPMLRREEAAGSASCVQVSDVADFPRDPPPQRIKIEATGGGGDGMFSHHAQRGEFVFDRVFEPGSQLEVFDQVARPLVETVLQGTNVTMFAYGQTGTGKTYTMEGPRGDEGLIQNAVRMLFAGLDGTKQVHYQYVQLYNTDFKDLLDPESTGPFAVEEGKKFMKVRGAKIALAGSPEELLQEVSNGAQYRASGKTNMNDASSRSHAVLSIILAPLGCDPEEGTVMYMVDLAGSERVKRSGVQVGSQGFSEATSINTALSALGRVVVGLVSNDGKRAAHIPYKDNDLTYLLKSGIGGRSKTALICCITAAEDSLDESINTLRFALQASHVKNRVADKESKDRIAAAAGAIEDSAHELVLSPGGTGECSIPGGAVPVRGFWSGDAPVVICIHDFGKDGSQFDALISELNGSARVLAPTLDIATEKDPEPLVAKILSLLDWLGVSKATFVGRDYGAILCVCFKLANPTRAGGLVLENRHQRFNAAEYKAKMKAQPDFVMKQYSDCWTLLGDLGMKFGVGAAAQKINAKPLKGKVALLWPCHFKGNPDPKMGNQHMAKAVAKEVKTQVTDSYSFSDADVAEHVLNLLPKDK